MIRSIAVRVWRDVRVEKPSLAFAYSHIRLFQLNSAIQYTLDLGSSQRRTGFIFRRDVIVMKGRAICRQNFFFDSQRFLKVR